MLAAHHDQENLYKHQAGASKQQLQAKTPGARFPKTPLKVPLNDENVNHGFNGKSVLRGKNNNENGKAGKMALVTPAGPRTGRAPLGNKTTNAKARSTYQTPGAKPGASNFEKSALKPTTTIRPKQAAPQTESSKLEVHEDIAPLQDEEIEYAPPNPIEPLYESEVFPENVLTFEGLNPENMFNGYYKHYFNRMDGEGKTAQDRDLEERQKRSFERGEEQIQKDMDDFDWSIGDIPESRDVFKKKSSVALAAGAPTTVKTVVRQGTRQPSTVASRKAASALAMRPKPVAGSHARPAMAPISAATKASTKGFLLPRRKVLQPIEPANVSGGGRAAFSAASRSTLGYNKGRSMSSAVHVLSSNSARSLPTRQPTVGPKPRAFTRTVSAASTSSDATITPSRYAQATEQKQPDFLSIFDDEEEDGLGGGLPPMDDDESDFQLTADFE
ncbi:uncharacterized protein C8A04DRAFT_13327 [Dichotomopilus funicola]|uniref:Uncharacterized protein n=1 Tax=Dichotomopilus funicola TaxID=1934379 RepID=A0AAN6UZZ2_9PEZI|nr:hypothetical protein C8A04DRAFT_13327 [Dichotomopilus funicola]